MGRIVYKRNFIQENDDFQSSWNSIEIRVTIALQNLEESIYNSNNSFSNIKTSFKQWLLFNLISFIVLSCLVIHYSSVLCTLSIVFTLKIYLCVIVYNYI